MKYKLSLILFLLLTVVGIRSHKHPMAIPIPAFLAKPCSTDNLSATHFREDIFRSGTSAKPMEYIPLGFRERFSVNQGVHSASKSSPLSLSENTFVASDIGILRSTKNMRYFRTNNAMQGIHSSPQAAGDLIIVGAYNGILYALDKNTLQVRWAKRVGEAIGATPLLLGNSIYVVTEKWMVPDGFVEKINICDGQTVWRSPLLGEQSHSSPTTDAKGNIYFGANNGIFFALSTEQGSIVWQKDMGAPIKGTPFYHKGILYFTTWEGALFALEAKDGSLVWKKPLEKYNQSSVTKIFGEENAFLSDKDAIIFFRLKDGKVLKKFPWTGQTGNARMPSGLSLASSSGGPRNLIACGEKRFCIFAGEKESFRLLKSYSLPSDFNGVPSWDGKRVYLALVSDGGLQESY